MINHSLPLISHDSLAGSFSISTMDDPIFFVTNGTVNHSQLFATNRNKENKMQREMPFLGECRKGQLVPDSLVHKCNNRLDAIRLCVQLSGLSHEHIASTLGIDKGHFSRMMQGRAHFPDAKSIELMSLCGNFAPMQYEAWATGFELFKDTKAQRKAELIAELQALENAA